MKKRTLLIVVLSFLILCPLILLGLITRSNGKMRINGQTRRYVLYKPDSYDANQPTALVMSLHGFADWPMHHMRVTGWNRIADQEGFIVVYPMGTGFPLRWNAHSEIEEDGSPNKDIIFLQALIAEMQDSYNIDPHRVFVNGLSNGAGMSNLLACSLGSQIGAVGGVAGAYLLPWEACATDDPIPVMLFHGSEDPIVPYEGGTSSRTGMAFPFIPEHAAQWASHNGCDENATEAGVSAHVSRISYTNCEENAEVVMYTVENGGHSWPGGCCLPKWIVSNTTDEINASREIWEFYQSQIKAN